MGQRKQLNFSRTPQPLGQYQPTPIVPGDGAATAALEARVDALETALAAAQSQIADLEATVADHETRIAALEP